MLRRTCLGLTVVLWTLATILLPTLPPTTHAAGGQAVGYYDMGAGQGTSILLPPILAAGGTPVFLNSLSALELASVDVLFVTNSDNDSFGAEYTGALGDIDSAVQNGLVLVVHDRRVTGANNQLPGGAGISFTRQLHNDIDIDNNSVINAGAFGRFDNTSLDNGLFSAHGYASTATLPTGATCYLIFAGLGDNCVAFSYPRGNGLVFYSSIPLDFFLTGFGSSPFRENLIEVYAPNVTEGAINGSFAPTSRVLRVPNNGEVTIYATAPVIVYENPGGNPVRVESGTELRLPFDYDGNGFDTYLLSKAYTYAGQLWIEMFIGGNHYVYILADDVSITRGQLPEDPVEWEG